MRFHKLFCAVAALLLIGSTCIMVQADTNINTTASLPLVLPEEDEVCLTDDYLTLDTLLSPSDTVCVEQDYAEALLAQYSGVMVQSPGSINLWDAPDGETLLCSLANGTVLRLLGIQDGWYKVFLDTTVGYFRTQYAVPVVYADYIEVSAAQDTASTAAETQWVPPISIPANIDLSQIADLRQSIADSAMNWIGVPYSYGGSSRSGTDCSGFTMSVFSQYGYGLWHGASDQYAQCRSVTTEQRDIGDLVFFNWGGGISHVGIYLGGGTFVHASTSSGVIISSLYDNYYANSYVGAGRILPD